MAVCSDGNYSPSALPYAVQPLGRRRIDAAPFGMHAVIVCILRLHRQESARAHMQRQCLRCYPCLRQARDQIWREMQRGSRRSDSPFPLREHGLIILTVPTVGRALARDIGRQRSEEHTSELQSLMRISYAVFCLQKKTQKITPTASTLII